MVENYIFTPHLCLAARKGVTPLEFREDLDTHKTRMNGLSCGEESMTIYSAVLNFDTVPACDGATDGGWGTKFRGFAEAGGESCVDS